MTTLPVRYNSLTGNYEVRLELQARILSVPALSAEHSEVVMHAKPQRLSIVIPEGFFQVNDPEAIINNILRQVQNLWTQAVAGMANKYTDLIIEALMPTIEQILREKDWGTK